MNKYSIITTLFLLITLAGQAQDKLIRVDGKSKYRQKSYRQIAMYGEEKARLLMPQGSTFGVECAPSFSPEWTLTYDSLAHALVYRIAEKSIWYSTYHAWHKQKRVRKNYSKSVLRRKPKGYVAPRVQTYSLAITPEQVQQLRAIWLTAVSTAEDREVFILDGIRWEYFIDCKRAKSHREENVLVEFTNKLADAVKTGSVSRRDSLLAASQSVITGLTSPPPPEILEPGTVRRLIVVDGTPLPDSADYVRNVPNTVGELVYFNRQQQTIKTIRYYYDGKDKQPLEEKYGVKVKGTIAEYTTGPDTLCDAYVRQHPESVLSRCHVEGYVLDEDGKPLADVWIHVEGRSQMGTGTASDSTGHFSFWLPRTWLFPSDAMLTAVKGLNRVGKIPITDTPVTIRFVPLPKRKNNLPKRKNK